MHLIFIILCLILTTAFSSCSNNTSREASPSTDLMEKQFIEVDHPHLKFVGRFHDVNYNGVKEKRFTWPGVYLRFQAKLSSLTVLFRESGDSNNRYKLIVDDSVYAEVTPRKNQTEYELLQDFDSSQSHEFTIYKSTEKPDTFGAIQGLYVDHNAVLEEPRNKSLKIEFIGDSFTVGYGNLSDKRDNCDPWSTTDNYFSYSRLIASHFNADHMTHAWSGRGLIQNYNETSPNPQNALPAMYKYTLQNSMEHHWDFSWHPDLVLIFLGLNDFSTEGDPSSDVFIKGYGEFLQFLKSKYPSHTKYLALGSKDFNISKQVQQVVLQEQQEGNSHIFYDELQYSNMDACHWHPNLESHQHTFEKLKTKVQEIARLE